MSGEQLGILGIELDLLHIAYVNLGEVVLVEISTQHLALVVDVLVLQLLLIAKDVISGVELLVLSVDGLLLLLSLLLVILLM